MGRRIVPSGRDEVMGYVLDMIEQLADLAISVGNDRLGDDLRDLQRRYSNNAPSGNDGNDNA